jgi:hypothetical protein
VLRDIARLFLHPGDLFAELPERNRATAALGLLLLVHMAYGAALVTTRVHDYEIEWAAQQAITQYILEHEGEDPDGEVSPALDALEKGAVFWKLLNRVVLVVGGPIHVLVGVAFLAGLLFVVVAFRGGKPNYATLAGVCAFAAYVELPRMIMRLFLVSQLHVTRVETSLAAFVAQPNAGLPVFLLLRRLDPFDWWYWILVGIGAYRSGLYTRRAAVMTVVILAVLWAVLRSSLDVPALAKFTITTSSDS